MIRIVHTKGTTTIESYDKLEIFFSVWTPFSSKKEKASAPNRFWNGLRLTLRVYGSSLFEGPDHYEDFYSTPFLSITPEEVERICKMKDDIVSINKEGVLIDLLHGSFGVLENPNNLSSYANIT